MMVHGELGLMTARPNGDTTEHRDALAEASAVDLAQAISCPVKNVHDNLAFLRDIFAAMGDVLAEYAQPDDPDGSDERRKLAADLDFLTKEVPVAIQQAIIEVETVEQVVSTAHPCECQRETKLPGTS